MKRQFKIQIGADKLIVRNVRRAPQYDKQDCDGLCDHTNKVIYIHTKQSEDQRLETLIHECLHRGIIVRIARPGFGPINDHASESQQISADLEIANDGTIEQLHAKITEAANLLPNRMEALT